MKMITRLYIDDLRECPQGFMVCRSSDEAIQFVKDMGCPEFISFDHDLGGDDTSMKFINWLIESALDGDVVIPDEFDYTIHSANPIGSENINSKMSSFLKVYFDK